jgi:hypothetical protein
MTFGVVSIHQGVVPQGGRVLESAR